jgi:hypothetical protein
MKTSRYANGLAEARRAPQAEPETSAAAVAGYDRQPLARLRGRIHFLAAETVVRPLGMTI